MKRQTWKRILLSVFALFLLSAFVLVPAAFAFDDRSGDNVVIGEDEVIDDDVYGGAQTFTVNGTIKGDLVIGAQTVVINGTVEGDLFTGAQSVTINGTVGDDVRVGAAALILGEKAMIGDDVLAGVYSLEAKSGSAVGGSVVFGGFQGLLAGSVGEDVLAGTAGLSLQGTVGGDVKAEVGTPDGTAPFNPFMGTPEMPAIPVVAAGLTLGPDAKIDGSLEYTSVSELTIDIGKVSGGVQHIVPQINEQVQGAVDVRNPIVARLLSNVQRLVTLILLSLLVVWLIPTWFQRLSGKLQTKPFPSLGWGTVIYFGFPIAAMILLGVAILLGLFFGFIQLGGLGSALVWLAIGAIVAGFVLFALVLVYLAKLVVGYAVGKWILTKLSPAAAEKVIWPLLLGVLIVVILIALPWVGWLFNFIITLFGLGTLWLMAQDMGAQNAGVTPAPAGIVEG